MQARSGPRKANRRRSNGDGSRPDHGVALALLHTTVLPATSAAAAGPPVSANGKLNGAITTHAP